MPAGKHFTRHNLASVSGPNDQDAPALPSIAGAHLLVFDRPDAETRAAHNQQR